MDNVDEEGFYRRVAALFNKQMDAAGSNQPLAFGTLPLDIKELLY